MSTAATPQVPTLTGDVSVADLGVTLLHEHVFVRSPELDRALPDPEWCRPRMVDAAVAALARLADAGVGTVVDLTVPGLGRDLEPVREVASRSPVRIVVATGWYALDGLPPPIALQGPGRTVETADPLASLMIRDLASGIEGTRLRAGMIKVAIGDAGPTPTALRVLEAAGSVQRSTGSALTLHTRGHDAPAMLDVLERLGVPLERVIVGHAGDSTDIRLLRSLADRGASLGLDRFGMEHVLPDRDRIRTLLALLDQGYAERIVLSQDAAVYSRATPPSWRDRHAPAWRLDHLVANVLPRLARELGDDAIARLMVDNPRRLLARAAASEPDRVTMVEP